MLKDVNSKYKQYVFLTISLLWLQSLFNIILIPEPEASRESILMPGRNGPSECPNFAIYTEENDSFSKAWDSL
jgi:hypothetical protein